MNALIKGSLSHPLISFQEFDRLFDEFFPQVISKNSFPEAKIAVVNDNLIVQFALAGYPEDHLLVEVSDDTITVTGKKVDSEDNLHAAKAFTWKRKEVSGAYDLDQSQVSYNNGLLTIKAPKKEEVKPKILKINNK